MGASAEGDEQDDDEHVDPDGQFDATIRLHDHSLPGSVGYRP